MSRKNYIVFAILLLAGECFAQGSYGGTYRGRFYRQAHMQNDQTMISFSNGFGNLEPTVMEAHFAARYGIVNQGRPWAITTNPKVMLRMADAESFPLRNPSFVVDMNYHRMLNGAWMKNKESAFYIGVEHHSNGQSGSFFLPGDTIIDIDNGNFAQNALEFGYTEYRNGNEDETHLRFQYLGLYGRVFPAFAARWGGHETEDRYGFYRAHLRFGIGGIRPGHRKGPFVKFREHSQLKLDLGYIFGEMLDAEVGDMNTRALVDVQYHYVLPFFNDISLMARFYRGQDYYNIRFNDTLSFLTFGLSSNLATTKSAMRYIKK